MSARARVGVIAFVALIVLSIAEWLAAIYATQVMLVLGPVIVLKAAIIVVWFMHVRELWRAEDEH
jgi:hypothetical protein